MLVTSLLLAGPAAGQGFVMLQGADTIAVERVTRGATGLEGELQMRAGQPVTIRYRATPGPDALIPSLTIETLGTPNDMSFSVTFRGDSAFADVGGTTQRIPAALGALPGGEREPARCVAVELSGRLVLQVLEGLADAVAQGFEPGAGLCLPGL